MGSNIKSRSASKVALESFDDLFGGNTAQENGIEQIINAPLAELYTFKDHPFRVEDDEKMEETTESIGLQHCKCGMSWKKDIGYFERTGDMVFALERRKVGKKTKQCPVIRYR